MSDEDHITPVRVLEPFVAVCRVLCFLAAVVMAFQCASMVGGRYGSDMVQAVGSAAASITFAVLTKINLLTPASLACRTNCAVPIRFTVR